MHVPPDQVSDPELTARRAEISASAKKLIRALARKAALEDHLAAIGHKAGM